MLGAVTQAEQLAAQAAQWQAAARPDMAAQLYALALQHDPSNVMTRWQLAECLTHVQQPEQAAEHFLQVAQAHVALGRQADALGICERVILIAPHRFVFSAVGPMVRRIGREARTVCARAAEAHLRAGRDGEGLQMLRLGSELDADSPEARLRLARIYKSRNMVSEAVEAMADAGDLLLRRQRFADYAKVAQLLLVLDPDHLHTLRELPRAYLELRRPHDAVRLLEQLTRVSRGDVVGYEILAQAFAFIGHTEKSLQVLERLVDELGALGRGNRADAILEHARAWRPDDLGFLRELKRMEVPKPASSRPAPPPPEDMPPEGTVSLSIADLIGVSATSSSSSEGVELTEAEGTITLELGPLMSHELSRRIEEAEATASPPPTPSAMPAPEDIEVSMSLDASALIAALANDLPDSDDDDEPTVARMRALTAEDVARAASRPPGPPPPPPPVDEDAMTLAKMKALTPEDIERALRARKGEDGSGS